MDFETLLLRPPALHADQQGRLVSWRAGDRLLRYLNCVLSEGQVTLETGAGVSTLVFAMKRCWHTTVVPDQAQVDRILQWCDENGVLSDRLTFHVMPSERVLPELEPSPLDLVLIDGAHSFPIPLLDWFYAGRRLRSGGTLIVDDTKIWTSHVLYDVLAKEPEWRIDHVARLEFFAAMRMSCRPLGEWLDQPYVLHHSVDVISTSMTRRTLGVVLKSMHLGRGALTLAQQREWSELRHRLAQLRGRRPGTGWQPRADD
jgi:predicted O-methyltransferase YrrM